MKTLVYIDHFKGEVQPASWEALGLAKSFGSAAAVVVGSGVNAVAQAALEYGADEVFIADDSALALCTNTSGETGGSSGPGETIDLTGMAQPEDILDVLIFPVPKMYQVPVDEKQSNQKLQQTELENIRGKILSHNEQSRSDKRRDQQPIGFMTLPRTTPDGSRNGTGNA